MYSIITEHGHHSGGWSLATSYDIAARLITIAGYRLVCVIEEVAP